MTGFTTFCTPGSTTRPVHAGSGWCVSGQKKQTDTNLMLTIEFELGKINVD